MNSKQLSIVLGVVVVVLLAVVGYMALRYNSQTDTLSQQNTVPNSNLANTNANTAQPLSNANTQQPTNTTPTTTDATANWKTYNFSGPVNFSIKHPSTWIPKAVQANESVASLSLTRGSYTITIGQADGGGGECIFSDTGKQPDGNFDVDLRNVSFTEISTPIGLIRRYPTKTVYPNSNFDFALSAKSGGKFACGAYSTPIGGISYDLPPNYDSQMLIEMDAIIKTIKK